jgi:5'(3')-deoxyribonucleotidase
MRIYKTNDDFLWLNVNKHAEQLFEIYELFAVQTDVLINDSFEYKIETLEELQTILNTKGVMVCIELCSLDEIINLNN